MSLFYLVISFGAVHIYWLGEPFTSWLSIFLTLYFLICTWAFPYIIKKLGQKIENLLRSGFGFLLWNFFYLFYYLISPFLYLYLKFFDTENKGTKEDNQRSNQRSNQRNNQSEKVELSDLGRFMSLIFLAFSFVLLHDYWLGEPFESYLSILVTLYLFTCTWAYPYIIKELDHMIDAVLEKPLGYVLLIVVQPILYFISPLVFIRLKFFDKKE